MRVKVVKNKVSAPFRQAEFDILFNEGISREGDILDLAIEEKLIQKSGAWFSHDGENLGQGRENTRQYLRDNPDLTNAARLLREQIIAAKGLPWASKTAEEAESATAAK